MADLRLHRKLLEFLALQPGQGARTFWTALYLCLVIAAYLMLKSASKSLFLERLGAVNLPYVTIIIAGVVGLFVAGYVRLARRMNPPTLVVGTLAVLISNLVLFWWLDRMQFAWTYPVLYVWVGMYGVIATTQVWTLANDLFTTREAKRVFGVIGSGGIVGAISGGMLTRFLVVHIGTGNLLLIAAGIIFVALCLVLVLARHRLATHTRTDDQPPPRQLLDSLRIVFNSPHLRRVASLVLVTALATKMVDWQFNAVAEVAFDNEDSRTAFFGAFDASTGLIGFVLQALLTSRLLMLMGLGGTILIFPMALALGTVALIPTLSLWAATLAKGSDQTLKHSIDRSSRELVYLPVSRAIKIQAKSAIDMVVDRTGDGLAGFVQLGLITLLTMQGTSQLLMVRQMGLVNLLFIGLWLLVALRLRRSYVAELGRSIGEGRVEVGSWHEALGGAETMNAVRQSLESDDETIALAALELVENNPEWDLTPTLSKLARDGKPELRARALAVLLNPDNPNLPEGVSEAFQQEDQTLLAECIELQLSEDPAERRKLADAILARAGGSARGVWIALMVRRLGPEFGPVARTLLAELLKPDSPRATREVAATAVGMLPAEQSMTDLLTPLLDDDDPRIASAAARSLGAAAGVQQLATLVPLLGRASTRKAARLALQSRGDESARVLAECAGDERINRGARLRIPLVLAGIGSPRALSALAGLLVCDDQLMVRATGEALYRLRLKRPEWSLMPARDARELILSQAYKCRELSDLLTAIEADPPDERTPAWPLMTASLRSAYRRHHLAVFQTLCLCYSPKHIVMCRRSLLDNNLELRANAAELLDNLVPRRLWRELLPILYAEEFARDGPAKRRERRNPKEALLVLAGGDDRWLQACAVHLIGERGHEAGREQIERNLSSPDDCVREAAVRALERLERRINELSPMTVVEKVVALQSVAAFRGTAPEYLSLVAAVAEEMVFPAGSEICRQDDPPGDTYVLMDGEVEVERDGRSLGVLGRGDTVGTWALFEDEATQITARVVEETRALRIDRWGFDEVLGEHPEIARALIQQLVQRMRQLAG